LIRKISGVKGEVSLSEALTAQASPATPVKKDLGDLMEEDNLDKDGEEVTKIAGKGISYKAEKESDELILHLVSTSLSNIHDKPNSPIRKCSDDTIEVHLNQDDVQVKLTDEHGNPLPLKDVDLQLKLPAKCKDTSFKGTLKQFVKKLKRSTDDDIIYTVKEKVKLTDNATGQAFDVDMSLRVKLPRNSTMMRSNTGNGNVIHQSLKKSNSFPFVESIRRSVVCPLMPWRCRGGDYEEEDAKEAKDPRKQSEVGKKIFQLAASGSPTVITKSPKRGDTFDDITLSNNNTPNKVVA